MLQMTFLTVRLGSVEIMARNNCVKCKIAGGEGFGSGEANGGSLLFRFFFDIS